MSRLEEYLYRKDVPLFLKLDQLVQNGPTGDFWALWKIARTQIREKAEKGEKFNAQELTVMEKLRKMAKYKRSCLR
jgi:hypothetical protein